MDLLIDTHAVIWFITDDNKLPVNIRQLIEDKSNNCYISIASYWEIAIKSSLGRLDLNSNLSEIFRIIEDSGFEILPITIKHILENANLKFHHQDPFDRIIIAQAIIEELSVISKDNEFEKYEISLIWKM